MTTSDSTPTTPESDSDIDEQQVTERLEQAEERGELPSLPQQQWLLSAARRMLNPSGENPGVDEYIVSSFSYLLNVMYKMATASDREAAAREIGQDLQNRFNKWVDERQSASKSSSKTSSVPSDLEAHDLD